MSEAMRSMVASYQKQIHSESSFLDEIQQKAEDDTDFANEQRADDWSVKEVCYWLSQIHLDKYIKSFRSQIIDGSILLRDLNQSILQSDLGVKRLHVNKMMREIKKLRAKCKMEETKDPKDALIHSLRQEIEELKQSQVSQVINTIPSVFNESRASFLQ